MLVALQEDSGVTQERSRQLSYCGHWGGKLCISSHWTWVYHGFSPLRVFPLPPPLLNRKRMESTENNECKSRSQQESPFHWKGWRRRKEKAAWGWKEQSKSLFAGEQRQTKQRESKHRYNWLSNASWGAVSSKAALVSVTLRHIPGHLAPICFGGWHTSACVLLNVSWLILALLRDPMESSGKRGKERPSNWS